MHIVLCHDSVIPPPKYGGTERVIDWLAKALVSLGHKVTLIAQPGSSILGVQLIHSPSGEDWRSLIPRDADIVHLSAAPSEPLQKPFLVTIHGNGKPGETFHPNTVFVSAKHASNHGSRHFVYNGIDPDAYTCSPSRDRYLVFLAKASWKVKNLAGAIEIARATGFDLEVLGSRDWPFSLHRLLPKLKGVRYRGMVGDQEKRLILSRARGLLFPVRWHEPFGLAALEALASGCPVFGTPYGSLPEIVTAAVGTLSGDAAELTQSVLNADRFSPEQCRARVTQHFTHLQMAKSYLEQYQSILETGRLKSTTGELEYPQAPHNFNAQELLPWKSIR